MKKLKEARLKKLLSKWCFDCNFRIAKGYKPQAIIEIDYKKKADTERQMQLIKNRYVIGISNENIPDIKRYRELEKRDFNKNVYYLISEDDRYFQIPKMIHDYYKELE